jgi:hypothetical protein
VISTTTGDCGLCQLFGSLIANDAKCTRGFTSRIAIDKSSIQQQEDSCHQQIGLKFKKTAGAVQHLEYNFV